MPNRSLFCDKRSMLLSKIGVCFLKIGVCFFETRSLFFWKSGFDFWKSEFVFFSKSEFVFWKSEYWPQILSCHSALQFEQNHWRIQGRGRGTCPPPQPPPLFLDQTEARRAEKKLFGDHPPPYLRVWMTPLPLIWRSLFQFSFTYGNKRPGRFI